MRREETRSRGPLSRARLLAMVGSILLAGATLAACSSSPSSSKKTTSSTSAPAPSSSAPTSGCQAKPATGKAKGASITISPATCLKNGTKVTITGSGFSPGSFGGLAECNGVNGQPTVTVAGTKVPVGCTNPLKATTSTSGSGKLNATFTIKTGVIGPPASGKDSAGKAASADAAKYPCPPTAAQASAGATCTISFGDSGGDQVNVPIAFAPGA